MCERNTRSFSGKIQRRGIHLRPQMFMYLCTGHGGESIKPVILK